MKNLRRGTSLLEVSIAAVLLAAILSTSIKMTFALVGQRRAAERRTVAIETAANVMERVAILPWNEVTSESLSQIKLPDELFLTIPSAKLTVDVTEDESPAAKHIVVAVSWTNRAGQIVAPVRVSAWLHPKRSGLL